MDNDDLNISVTGAFFIFFGLIAIVASYQDMLTNLGYLALAFAGLFLCVLGICGALFPNTWLGKVFALLGNMPEK